jgi:hypothetical protein
MNILLSLKNRDGAALYVKSTDTGSSVSISIKDPFSDSEAFYTLSVPDAMQLSSKLWELIHSQEVGRKEHPEPDDRD